MRKTLGLVIVLAATLSASGCVHKHSVRMDWVQPPRLTLPEGASVFVDGQAAPVHGSDVVDGMLRGDLGQVVRQMAKGAALPMLEAEFKESLAQRRLLSVENGRAQYALRLTPTSWAYSHSGRTALDGTGKLDVRVTVLDEQKPTAPPLYEDIIWGRAGSRGLGEGEAMRHCAEAIADEFLNLFKPATRSGWFELDDEDPAVENGIELAREGLLDGAYDAFFAAVRANPQSAPAVYNFGVITGAKGNLDEAERHMTHATTLQQKRLYYRAIDIVRSARRERDAAAAQSSAPGPEPAAPAAHNL